MILDEDIKSQLSQYLKLMEGDVLLKVSAGSDSVSKDMLALINELTNMSLRIKVKKKQASENSKF